jgi:hypothetical protein
MTDSVPGPGDQHEDNAKDARVQVLTAEVRTLVVGSRQVTMSVYNQLDEVDYDEIEPFGRVSPKDAEPAFIYTVGRRRDARDLVRPAGFWSARPGDGASAHFVLERGLLRSVRIAPDS